ncbi:hypothetical protein DIURU_003286 [Diutina rugosa]|uniref:Double-strand break repair protein n=1 Tax=Diutina rugosa TaxID=5481 RepID=A0A642UQY6_DIURU|nr:uncharacterized protein DIURU_003286 [Diutina rugosa]KAA8901341.1 hypothetical protein DIURU_003286 [Diutina rugosa]
MRLPSIAPGRDTFSILLTTDNHVGAYEDDPIRGDDGWKTWHEITSIAADRDVDMIVQGGDLFHINKPSKKSMYQVMKSIRANCFGDRPVEMELLSDPSGNFTHGFNFVNYEDPNLNVSVPIFSISGNHDDATGDGLLSPIDILAISGMVNHFGKVENNEDIEVSPILLRKGTTQLALYGLQNVRDERLHRSFRDGKVKFLRPTVDTNSWFNLFCIHQNHAQHSITSHIPESFLPTFLDFILWGHEHECIVDPMPNAAMEFDVLQAGSSMATSLADGELAAKHVFILNIKGKDYSLEAIPLTSVRPFILKHITLEDSPVEPGPSSRASVVKYLTEQVEEAIAEANNEYLRRQHSVGVNVDPPLPLIRLKVEYSGGYEIENTRRFSNRFVGKVANVNDIIHFYKKRQVLEKVDKPEAVAKVIPERPEIKLDDILHQMLGETKLTLLPENGMDFAVKKYLETEDKHVLEGYINQEIIQESQSLLGVEIDTDEFHRDDNHSRKVLKQVLEQLKREQARAPPPTLDFKADAKSSKKSAAAKGKAAAAKSKNTKSSRAKPAKSKEFIVSDDEEDEERDEGEEEDEDDVMIISDSDNEAPPKKPTRRKRTK